MNINQQRKQCISNVKKYLSNTVEKTYIHWPLLHEVVSYRETKHLRVGNRYRYIAKISCFWNTSVSWGKK